MKKYIFLTIIFLSQKLFSSEPLPLFPNGLDCYVRTELNYFASDHYNSTSFFNLHIGLRANILKIAELKFSYGFSFYVEEYSGFTSSIIIEKEIYKNYKLLIGINRHFNNGVSHGTSAYVESYDKTFINYIIGSGINLSENTSIDFQLYIPDENEYGYSFYSASDGWHTSIFNIKYILKIGVEFNFNLIK